MNIKTLFVFCLFFVAVVSTSLYAREPYFLVDGFENKSYDISPEWFQFGDVKLDIKSNIEKTPSQYLKNKDYYNFFITGFFSLFNKPKLTPLEFKKIGKYSLKMSGAGSDWYLGGIGTYLGIDLRPYNAMQLYIKGTGALSGRLKIELFDDDANRWMIEHEQGYDKWAYELNIDWLGWKKVIIPFAYFKVENKGRSNGIWDPYQTGNSGGLIQIQLVALTPRKVKDCKIDFQIDEISFVRRNLTNSRQKSTSNASLSGYETLKKK